MSLKLKAILISLIVFVAWIVIAPIFAKTLVIEKPLIKADAILVLAGSKSYRERTQKAAELYKEGIASRVFLTDDGGFAGWSQKEERNPPFVDLAKQVLIKQGVAKKDIEVFKPIGSGTIYEAKLIDEVSRTRNLESILLVTSSYHTRRALWTFEKKVSKGKIRFGVMSPNKSRQAPSPYTWWLSPKGWQNVGGEYPKFLVYWLYY